MEGKYFTRPSPSRYEGGRSMISFHMAAPRPGRCALLLPLDPVARPVPFRLRRPLPIQGVHADGYADVPTHLLRFAGGERLDMGRKLLGAARVRGDSDLHRMIGAVPRREPRPEPVSLPDERRKSGDQDQVLGGADG